MSKIKYGADELEFVDKKGDVLGIGDVVKVDGMDGLWDIKDMWVGDDIPMITAEDEIGNKVNILTASVRKI